MFSANENNLAFYIITTKLHDQHMKNRKGALFFYHSGLPSCKLYIKTAQVILSLCGYIIDCIYLAGLRGN